MDGIGDRNVDLSWCGVDQGWHRASSVDELLHSDGTLGLLKHMLAQIARLLPEQQVVEFRDLWRDGLTGGESLPSHLDGEIHERQHQWS